MSSSKGKLVWFDLMTSDTAAAKRFHGELIGWKTQTWKSG
jgi:predicted enzyme related to lactoylglutathione lyase